MADLLLGADVDPASHQRTEKLVSIPSGDLTTHGVIVGMTGSGKTGLGVVLIEDVLSAGIPALLIDPKGDLTNLCLTFPDLAASDFQPWINAGDAQKAGKSVDDFAADQAKAWTDGLASWNLGGKDIGALRDKAAFTIYTPGSKAGVGLNIVGSLRNPGIDDEEALNDEIDGFVGGLLGLVGIDADPLSSKEHILLSNLILNEWSNHRDLDLPTLVGMVMQPPIRKLGVFDLEQFYPQKDRTGLAMKLNGLLASTSFGSWMSGPALDIESMLHTANGKPRCAIVTTAQLSDQERMFVTTLVLSKLVTWMRRQSGTTDLRALLYMDEVAGYLPPTAVPPTKKPILNLMKQARAFGVGVVLATQNPVDVDYKALSNAGTWMIGRLQTDQDKARLLDGMSAARGGVDVDAVGNTIAGLAKREFVLRRAGKDQPEVFTTRWAMSYLRGPLTGEQISTLMTDQKAAAPEAAAPSVSAPAGAAFAPTSGRGAGDALPAGEGAGAVAQATGAAATAQHLGSDETNLQPAAAKDVPVKFVDPAAPWLASIGGDARGTRFEAAVVARVNLRFDDAKANLVLDEEYEQVLFPLSNPLDPSKATAVDYDDRDLRDQGPVPTVFRLPSAPIGDATTWSRFQRDLVDYLVRSQSAELQSNPQLKLFSRPGESAEDFAKRCADAAGQQADAETAALRDKYTAKIQSLQAKINEAEDRTQLLQTQKRGRESSEILSTAGSVLGGLLGGRRSRGGLLGKILGRSGTIASRRAQSAAAGDRLDAAENKLDALHQQLDDLNQECQQEIVAIDTKWSGVATQVTTVNVPLERTDVQVTQLVLAWVPVP